MNSAIANCLEATFGKPQDFPVFSQLFDQARRSLCAPPHLQPFSGAQP
jgi:hypothetical protein